MKNLDRIALDYCKCPLVNPTGDHACEAANAYREGFKNALALIASTAPSLPDGSLILKVTQWIMEWSGATTLGFEIPKVSP